MGVYKGRLCDRGDSVPLTHTSFASSPTVHRCGVKIICMLTALFPFQMKSVDVSQAFLQSDNLSESDRRIVIPPLMALGWGDSRHEYQLKDFTPPSHGFLIIKPLCGTRDAPLRWFVRLRKAFIQVGLRQMKSDICMYSRVEAGEFQGAMLIHVGDILYTGTREFITVVESAIKQFRIGGIGKLTQEKGSIFTGLEIQLNVTNRVALSRKQYVSELPTMDISQYMNRPQLANVKDLQSTARQGLGALIWVHQSRPDVGFLITKIATDLMTACADRQKAIRLAKLYNKTVRYLKMHASEIHYVPPPGNHGKNDHVDLRKYRVSCFTDAGFGALHGDHSIESNVAIFGKVLFRDGSIQCHGFLIDHRCAKIQRVCLSPLSAECHAAVTAGDYALRYQIVLVELLTQRYQIRQLCHPTDCPMLNHYENSPSNEKLQAENYSTSIKNLNHQFDGRTKRFCATGVFVVPAKQASYLLPRKHWKRMKIIWRLNRLNYSSRYYSRVVAVYSAAF